MSRHSQFVARVRMLAGLLGPVLFVPSADGIFERSSS
jgi:hypothetical protein